MTQHGEVHLDGFRLQLPSPLPPAPPVYLAALGNGRSPSPGNTPMADAREHDPRQHRPQHAGAPERGRRQQQGAGAVDLIARFSVLVDDDVKRARARVGRIAGFYLSSDVYRRSVTRQGFGAEVERFADGWDAGERSGAVEQLGDEILSAFAVFGDEQTVGSRIAQFRAAGLDAPMLYPIVPGDGASYEDVVDRTLAVLSRLRGM